MMVYNGIKLKTLKSKGKKKSNVTPTRDFDVKGFTRMWKSNDQSCLDFSVFFIPLSSKRYNHVVNRINFMSVTVMMQQLAIQSQSWGG